MKALNPWVCCDFGKVFWLFISSIDSTAVSILADILVEFTNAAFFNSTNISTNIETVMISTDSQLKELKVTSDKTFLRTRLV